MYKPSTYENHNETEREFSKLFNSISIYKNIVMNPNSDETYDDDGMFIDTETNQTLRYDWSFHKTNIFANCKYKNDEFSVFNRKFDEDQHQNIQMFIQRDKTNTGIAAAWFDDCYNGNITENREIGTDTGTQITKFRTTNNFRIYSLENIEFFKSMIAHAMKFQIYSPKIFEIMDNKIYKTKSIEENNQMVFPDWAM